jgi:23S rRNA (pseudouridine1915-N3)-methyltransferase
MNFRIISAARVKDENICNLESHYLKQSKSIEIIEPSRNLNSALSESEWLIRKGQESDFIISLDERGQLISSMDLAKLLSSHMNKGKSSFSFLIGAAYGLSEEVRNSSNMVLSLSPMTFPFQIARLLVVEQVYRILCNLKGHPYHK